MGKIYKFLGMTVGVIQNDLDDFERQESYRCDITYGTNNEFGFDYLRDNMKFEVGDLRAARALLRHRRRGRFDPIDEARTPLIISGASTRPASITRPTW